MSDLVDQIDALLALNAKGAVSHPVPGLAVELLERAKLALTFPSSLSLGHPIQGEADAVTEVAAFVNAVQVVEDAGWLVLRPEQVASQPPTPAGVREITEEMVEQVKALEEACNQSRLALAGMVSVQSALDKLDCRPLGVSAVLAAAKGAGE